MERRELIRRAASGCALALASGGPFRKGRLEPGAHDDFDELLDEARAAFCGEEYRRAYELFTRASRRVPASQPIAMRAEILECQNQLREILKGAEECAARHRAGIQTKLHDPEGYYWFAFALTRAGRDEEALVEYQSALALHYDKEGCWYGIGLSHCRQRRYQEALPWLERIDARAQPTSMREISTKWRALEQRLVIYSELGLVREAEEATRYHIRCYGRVGRRERRALRKLGIDADAMYVEHCGHSV